MHIHPDAWVAPNATLIGSVRIGAEASVWYGAVIRADGDAITVGERSNIQDNCTLHADPGFPLTIGPRVAVGHGAILHGCTIEPEVLVGMGSIVMNGAVIGTGSIIGAGAVVSEGVVVPPRSLVLGLPGKVRREVDEEEYAGILRNTSRYAERAAANRALAGTSRSAAP